MKTSTKTIALLLVLGLSLVSIKGHCQSQCTWYCSNGGVSPSDTWWNVGKVGIGLSSPSYILDVAGGDINIATTAYGLRHDGHYILQNPNSCLFVGQDAGSSYSSGDYNTYTGYIAGYSNTSGSANTLTGFESGRYNTASNNSALGYQALYSNTSGTPNDAFGYQALYTNTTGTNNKAFGYQALYSNSTGDKNVAFGDSALHANTASNNCAMGFRALSSNTSASDNSAFGYEALKANTTGAYNTATGVIALLANTTGNYNAAFGGYALLSNSGGSNNTAVGHRSLNNNTTDNNTGVGYEALYSTTSGNANTAIGQGAGYTNSTGGGNTYVGDGADANAGTYSNSTALGSGATVCASNIQMFGNSSVVGWGFGNSCPTSTKVFIVGTSTSNGNGAYLSAGGTWTNASDREKKENIVEVEGKDILKKIDALSISSWNYKGEEGAPKHIGPMAQDFYKIFAVGNDDKSISTIDPAGVALAGIKELNKKVSTLTQSAKVDSLVHQLGKQDSINKVLQNQINQLVQNLNQCCNSNSNSVNRTAAINTQDIDLSDAVVLNQNQPNPFAEQTLITYNIPASANNAQIMFYDVNGKQINSTIITTKGKGALNVYANDLSNGTYSYTLVIDGKVIDAKKMVKQQ